MPNRYVRICDERGKWSQDDLLHAVEAVRIRQTSVRQAALEYGVPRKTLERRLKSENFAKGRMGPSSVFGAEHEKRLVKHILKLQKSGFPVTPKDLRSIAFHFAEQLGITHSFNVDKEEAGYVWLKSFLLRNPVIKVRKSEGVSLARCQALNRTEVNAYFDLLYNLLEEYDLFDKPSNIFNMDETGLQLNSRPGHVLAEKGSKVVSTVTSTEKGETITVIGCCNAEGVFLPPACIMKGKNKKPEWQDGMPPGSVLFMSQKSAYINTKIFFEWLKTHFAPRKPTGKILLILDGHTSHCNSVEMLEYAAAHDICLFTLPSHTTHYLQTLDRSVFKSVKSFYYEACRIWLKRNPGRRLTRLQFGELLSVSWCKAATPENAIAGFKATGVYPFNRLAVPEYAFTMADLQENPTQSVNQPVPTEMQAVQRNSSPLRLDHSNVTGQPTQPIDQVNQPGPSGMQAHQRKSSPSILEHSSLTEELATTLIQNTIQATPTKLREKSTTSVNQDETPSKILNDLSPIPIKLNETRKRSKQVATVLTSEIHISYRKDCDDKKNVVQKKKIKKEKSANEQQKKAPKRQESTDMEYDDESITEKKKIKGEKSTGKERDKKKNKITLQREKVHKGQESTDMEDDDEPISEKKKIKREKSTGKERNKKKNKSTLQRKKTQKGQEFSDTEEEEPILLESGDSSLVETNINDCVACGENYFETQLTEDWIECIVCKGWVHENCTEFDDKCHPCGRKAKNLKENINVVNIQKAKGKGKGEKVNSVS